jgi:hypothetical protein
MIPQYNLPATAYPLTIIALRSDNRAEVWRHHLMSPGAVYIPPLAKQHGVKVIIRIEYADGTVDEKQPT